MYFSFDQIILLFPSIILLGVSVVLFRKQKTKASLILLFFASLCIACFIALLDPYLHVWDEQYHALVAKNMMDNIFYPLLYKYPILDFDYKLWTDNHIWLHKQPLFLWQMAISMKIFGVNEFTVRLPSVILHAIIPLFVYRIGKISLNNKIGFYAAIFFALAYYPLELVAGKNCTDHNDFVFLFYITASFWAWFEYTYSKKTYWLLLIGLFAGCAVLVKWLMGLLVYICWGLSLFSDKKEILQWRTYIPIIKSFFITLILVIPWQIYILYRFPIESRYEFSSFSSHLYKAVEGHGGSIWFHIQGIQSIYGFGFLTQFILIISLFILYKKIKTNDYKIFIIGAILFVYILYTVAATKMLSFGIIVSPLIYIGFSALFITIIDFIETKNFNKYLKKVLFYVLLSIICFFVFNIFDIHKNHTMYMPLENDNRTQKLAERDLIKNLDNILNKDKYVIFNTTFDQGGNIPFMFYTDYIAYRCIPTKEECEVVLNKGYKIAILDFNNLPNYILNDESIVKIPAKK